MQNPEEIIERLTPNNGTVIIPIGLPGSGKSTFTQFIRDTVGYEVAVHSTDSFFIGEDGLYNFDRTKAGYFHKQNLENFERSLQKGVPIVIVDNTNLKSKERNKYVRLATAHGYSVQMVVIGEFDEAAIKRYAQRNRHGLTLDEIRRMAESANIPEEAL